MPSVLLTLVLLVGLATLVVAIDIAKSLREVRDFASHLEGLRPLNPLPPRLEFRVDRGGGPVISEAVWVFRNETWQLESSNCPEDYEPGPPPHIRGNFEGERVRQECIRRRTD